MPKGKIINIGGRLRPYVLLALLLFVDYIGILLAEIEAFSLVNCFENYGYGLSYILLWVPLIFMLFLGSFRAYNHMSPLLDDVRGVVYSVGYGIIACIILLFFTQMSIHVSRLYLFLFSVLVLTNLLLFRYLVRTLLKKAHLLMEPVLIIGAGLTAKRVLHFFEQDLGYRYEVRGFLDDKPVCPELLDRYPLLGGFDEAETVVRKSGVQTVIIAVPGLETEYLSKLIARIQPQVRYLNYIPDLIGTPMASVSVDTFFSEKILMLKLRNNLARRRNRIYKRLFDLAFTIVGGLVILPVIVVVAILVTIDSQGHPIFAHRRIGKGGKEFPCYKFQSMVPNAGEILKKYLCENPEARKEWEENFKLTNDPRVTKLGAFLRKTSLDELPQLWNVIKGEMSLVGPRPIVKKEVPRYGQYIKEYCMVLPGITGMWQASGRSDTTYSERVAMDIWYVHNWSVWIDLMYLAKTFTAVFTGKGAY